MKMKEAKSVESVGKIGGFLTKIIEEERMKWDRFNFELVQQFLVIILRILSKIVYQKE